MNMDWEIIASAFFCGILAAASFFVAYRQHKQVGFVANNRWIWASNKEREDMDERVKKADYRLGRNLFILIGVMFSVFIIGVILSLMWIGIILIGPIIIYALVHDAKNRQLYYSITDKHNK